MNKSDGTVADTLGNFSFKINQNNLLDMLQISRLGYLTIQMRVKDFLSDTDKIIRLDAKRYELPETAIKTTKAVVKTVGRQSSGKLIQVSIHNKETVAETVGSEMGMRYKLAGEAVLKDFNFFTFQRIIAH